MMKWEMSGSAASCHNMFTRMMHGIQYSRLYMWWRRHSEWVTNKKIKKSIDEGLIGIYHYPSCKRVLGVGDGSLIKYGWLKQSDAVNLLFGSRIKILRINNNASSLIVVLNMLSSGCGSQSSQVNPLAGNGKVLWSGQLLLSELKG